MKIYSHLNSAVAILKVYNGSEPFHLYIKKFFATNKKYGSKDRKQITALCYNYFRLGHAGNNISIEDKILIGTFLCENQPSALLQQAKPKWNELIEKTNEEKLSIVNSQFSIKNIFPFADELSESIDADKFSQSFLIQPELFLRIRPGNHKRVTGKLSGAGLSFKLISEECIALPNTSKISSVIYLDKEAVVQDYNSQKIAGLIQLKSKNNKQPTVWDCCAASGGKSILTYDIYPDIELSVSDKRESILENLKKRFAVAGIKKYYSFNADLSTGNWQQVTKKFDLIICDSPCTGSGTWSRTPDQLFYFKKESIAKYAMLQKQILLTVVKSLKPGGKLLYITCSVFKKENEEVVLFVQKELKLKLEISEMFKGYEMKADTLFAALFTAPTI